MSNTDFTKELSNAYYTFILEVKPVFSNEKTPDGNV